MTTNHSDWDEWNESRAPRYPHGKVIQFVLRNFTTGQQSGQVALDLGAGSGVNSLFLAEQGFFVVSTDFSKVGIGRVRADFQKHGLSGLQLVQDLGELDLGDFFVDLVISIGVFECSGPGAAAEGLRRLRRFLKPNARGLFVFASNGDFRTTGGEPLVKHGYSEDEVHLLFRDYPEASIDQYMTTYDSGKVIQHEWIVTF